MLKPRFLPGVALVLVVLAAMLTDVVSLSAAGETDSGTVTRVVMLGTGTPNPDPARSGPAVAIVVNDIPYLVDFGPGVMRRAASLSPAYGGAIAGLQAKNFRRAFLTHLHSDHSAGFADLIFTPWIFGRNKPLEVFGPPGISNMASNILMAYREDIRNRVTGFERANDVGWRVNTHDVKEGQVYEDENVSVEAFNVRHGSWKNAFGYRFSTPDKVIVISGDTAPNDNIEKYSRGADILIHEVYSANGIQASPEAWREYMRVNHTSGYELAELATRVKPGLLVLNHVLLLGTTEERMLAEVTEQYDGAVVLADDLDVF